MPCQRGADQLLPVGITELVDVEYPFFHIIRVSEHGQQGGVVTGVVSSGRSVGDVGDHSMTRGHRLECGFPGFVLHGLQFRLVNQLRGTGALECRGYACLMPAGVTISGQSIRTPIHTLSYLLPHYPQLRHVRTHISLRGLSIICRTNFSSIHDRGVWSTRLSTLCITPWLSSATVSDLSHPSATPAASTSAIVANVPRYRYHISLPRSLPQLPCPRSCCHLSTLQPGLRQALPPSRLCCRNRPHSSMSALRLLPPAPVIFPSHLLSTGIAAGVLRSVAPIHRTRTGDTPSTAAWVPCPSRCALRLFFFFFENHYSYSVYPDYDERLHLQVGYPAPHVKPFTAFLDHPICGGAFRWIGWACRMPADFAMCQCQACASVPHRHFPFCRPVLLLVTCLALVTSYPHQPPRSLCHLRHQFLLYPRPM